MGTCKICGCTDNNCSQCIEKTGKPCYWVNDENDLCSACVEVLETEFLNPDAKMIYKTMFDGTKYKIGTNVQDFYFKLINLPISHRCQLLNLNIKDLENFIVEHRTNYNEKALSEFKKVWLWKLDSEVYDFSDTDTNNEFFGLELTKKQIVSKLKRNTLSTDEVFRILEFFKDNNDVFEKEN